MSRRSAYDAVSEDRRLLIRATPRGGCYRIGHTWLRVERWEDPIAGDWVFLVDCATNRLRYRVLANGRLVRLVRRRDGWVAWRVVGRRMRGVRGDDSQRGAGADG